MEAVVMNKVKELSFYKNKRVFITGHTGFKGTWLSIWLDQLGANLKGYALEPENSFDLYNQIANEINIQSVIADIRSKQSLENEILSFQPDIIFHLAAQPLVKKSYENPIETFEVNTIGTANVLEAARKLEKQCSLVLITTDKVYENKEWVYPYRETDRLGGYDPYSASKATAELVISSFRNSFFNLEQYQIHKKSIASARAGNVIGGGDWAANRIIPDIVKALQSNQAIEIRNPQSVRPWQHVLEPLFGYLLLGVKLYDNPLKYSGAWNFGPLPDSTFTVEDLVNKSIEIWGNGAYKITKHENQVHEANLLKLDISKSVDQLGWKPCLSAQETIEWTIGWYKNWNSYDYILQQINKYQQL